MKKGYLLICLLLVTLFTSEAQKATIKGTVIDSRTKETLVGVNVYADAKHGTVTDVFGNYILEVEPGSYTVKYSFVGYGEYTQDFNLKAGDIKNVNISMVEKTKLLDEVVVSVGRHEQKLADLTVSVELIKPKMLENNNTISLESALQQVPGVTIYEDQASIRGGSGYSYGAGSRVLLLLDDLPLLTGATGEAKWWIIPIENIDQVEVIKGAASAMYGSSAMNGIMNVRTAWPTSHPETKLVSYTGVYTNPQRPEIKWWSNNLQSFSGYQIMHSEKLGNFDFVVSGNLLNDQGYRKDDYSQRVGINFKTRYRSKKYEGLSYGLNAGANRRWTKSFLFWRTEKEINGTDTNTIVYPYEPDPNVTVMEQTNTYLTVDPFLVYFTKTNKHSLKGRVLHANNETNTNQNNKDIMYYGEYQYQHIFGDNLVLNSGASGSYCASEAQIFGADFHYASSAGIFSQIDKKWNRLNLSLGARIEGYRDGKQAMEWKPVLRAGANYRVGDKTFFRASFGQGYRYPTIGERYMNSSADAVNIFPNPYLKSEIAWSGEIGLKQAFTVSNWNAFVDIAGFFTDYTDMIEFRFDTYFPDSLPTFYSIDSLTKYITSKTGFKAENVSKVQIYGFELSLTGRGSIRNIPISFLAGYTFINPVDLSGDSSNTTSFLKYRFQHNVKADVDISYKKLSIGGSFEYFSKMVSIDQIFEDEIMIPIGSIRLPSGIYIFPGMKEYREQKKGGDYYLDFRVAWQINANSKFAVVLKNALNREYMIRPGDVQPPRNIALQYSFRM